MTLTFSKYHGLGNDFMVVDGPAPSTEAVKQLCDRHRGIGGDGVIAVDGLSMRVINADGSEPEMCGNGIRCVALHLLRRGEAGPNFPIQTAAGVHLCQHTDASDSSEATSLTAAAIRVQMTTPALGAAAIGAATSETLMQTEIELEGARPALTAVSMGNPHVVLFEIPKTTLRELGPAIASHPWFPRGVNVGFAQIQRGAIHLDVLERGAGWTQACGTGACAAAVAAVETGRLPRGEVIPVHLPGGVLHIEVGEAGEPVWMTGRAEFVFQGEATIKSA